MKKNAVVVTLLFGLLIIALPLQAQVKEIAVVIKVVGQVQVKSGTADWQALQNGRRLHSGDFVKTGEGALVALVFTDDKSMIKIRSNSQIQIDGERTEQGIAKKIIMTLGQMWSKISPKGAGYQMVTPSGVAAVRGTEFYGIVELNKMTIIGIDGIVAVSNAIDSVLVTAGKTGTSERDLAPVLTDTQSFEQWANTDDTADTVEIEFEDANGARKKLKIKFQE